MLKYTANLYTIKNAKIYCKFIYCKFIYYRYTKCQIITL